MRLHDDVRVFVRTSRRVPVAVSTTVCVLALAMGATAVAFNFLDAILLQPSPVRDVNRLVSIWTQTPGREQPPSESSYPQYREWREQGRTVFEDVTTMGSINFPQQLIGRGEPVRVHARAVSDSFFDVLGAKPLLGRTLRPADNDVATAELVLVMSWGLWHRQFGGDPAVIGSPIRLDKRTYTVVGVMPRDFQYPAGAEVWFPLAPGHPHLVDDRRIGWLETIARLRDGVGLESARREAQAIAMRGFPPGTPQVDVLFVPLREEIFGLSRPALVVLMFAALLLLLMAAANVGHLLLVRATARRNELAVRQALGASRARLAQQQFAESLTLAVTGGAVGLLLAAWAVKALLPFVPIEIPGLHRVGMNARTIAVTGIMSVVTAVLTSVAPLMFAWIRAPAETLNASSAATMETRGGQRLRRALMCVQIALSVIVLIGAGLLVRSFLAIKNVELGFHPANVVKMDVALDDDASYDELLRRVRRLPGVRAAGAVYLAPLEHGPIGMDAPIVLFGQPLRPESYDANPAVNWEAATPGYFEAIGLPLVQGRVFDDRDTADSPAVVVISESLARYLSPDGRAVGRRLVTLDGPRDDAGRPVWQDVVGVVKDGRYRELTRTRFDVYLPHTQTAPAVRHLVVRGDRDPLALVAPIRPIVRAIKPGAIVDGIVRLEDVVMRARAGWTFNALVFTLFGALSLVLVAVGLFGLLAYASAARTREIGIRLALGARRWHIARLMLSEAMTVLGAGLGLGLATVWVTSRALESLLFGVSAQDTVTFAAAAVLVLAICAVVSWWPARAAMSVTPLVALRRD